MGHFLSDTQLEELQTRIQFAAFTCKPAPLPLEIIVAATCGAKHLGKQVDYVLQDCDRPNVSFKSKTRNWKTKDMNKWIGRAVSYVAARPKVYKHLKYGHDYLKATAQELGDAVLSAYNEEIIEAYDWHRLACLLNVSKRYYLFWEEPIVKYIITDYYWVRSGKNKKGQINIKGYTIDGDELCFNFNSTGGQFQTYFIVPKKFDIIEIDPERLSLEEIKIFNKVVEKSRNERRRIQTRDKNT